MVSVEGYFIEIIEYRNIWKGILGELVKIRSDRKKKKIICLELEIKCWMIKVR